MMHHLEMFCYWLKEKSTFCESALGRIWMFCGCRSTDSILCVSAGGRIDALKGRRFVGESLRSLKKSFVRKVRPPPLSSLFKGYTSQCCCCCFYSLSIMWRGHKLLYVYMFGSGSNKMAAGFFCTRRGGGWCATTCYIYAAVCVCV